MTVETLPGALVFPLHPRIFSSSKHWWVLNIGNTVLSLLSCTLNVNGSNSHS